MTKLSIAVALVVLLAIFSVTLAAPDHARFFRHRTRYDNQRLVRVRALSERALGDLLGIIGSEPDGMIIRSDVLFITNEFYIIL